MMPDGAEPCTGYQKLQAEIERLQAQLTQAKAEIANRIDFYAEAHAHASAAALQEALDIIIDVV